jgi:hypothetical protein
MKASTPYLLISFVFCFLSMSAQTQESKRDEVHLKNGAIIRGKIIEPRTGDSLRIKTRDGDVVVYAMHEVAKISAEIMSEHTSIGFRGEKSPFAAFLLSFMVPGLGQYYNGHFVKGAIQQAFFVGGWIMISASIENDESGFSPFADHNPDLLWSGVIVTGGAWLWSTIDAPMAANKINKERKQSYGHLIQVNKNQYVIGLDLGADAHKKPIAILSVHF